MWNPGPVAVRFEFGTLDVSAILYTFFSVCVISPFFEMVLSIFLFKHIFISLYNIVLLDLNCKEKL